MINRMLVLLFGLLIGASSEAAQVSQTRDLEIVSFEVFYKDNVTVPGQIIKRKLTQYSEHPVWSKPSRIDVAIVIKNNSVKESSAVVFTPTLFYLIRADVEKSFPSITTMNPKGRELKDITKNKGVWVWNKVLASTGIKIIAANEELKIELEDLDISNICSPVDYYLEAFAVRAYIESNLHEDLDYSNNVKEIVIRFPM